MRKDPDALRQEALAIWAAGEAAAEAGDTAAAEQNYRAALRLFLERLEALSDDTEVGQAMRDVFVAHTQLGDLARDAGRLDEALDDHTEALALSRRVQAQVGDTPEVLRDLSISLGRLGDLASGVWRLDEARGHWSEALNLGLQMQSSVGDTLEVLDILLPSLSGLGELARFAGRVDEARDHFSRAVALLRGMKPQVRGMPERLQELSHFHGWLGLLAHCAGRVDEARNHYSEGVALLRCIPDQVGDTPEVLLLLGFCLSSLYALAVDIGSGNEAQGYYNQMRDVSDRLHSRVGDSTLNEVQHATIAQYLACECMICGDPDGAALHFISEALTRLCSVQARAGDRKTVSEMMGNMYSLRAKALGSAGGGGAGESMLQAFGCWLAEPVQRADWPKRAANGSVYLTDCAKRGTLPAAEVLLIFRRLSQSLVSHLDLQPTDVVGRAQEPFARMHACWLALALVHDPSQLPEILSAIQGRKLAALVLAELEANAANWAQGSPQARYLALRTELRRLALGLQVLEGGRKPRGLDTRGFAPELDASAHSAQLKAYQDKLAQYQQLRLELSRDPDFAVVAPKWEVELAGLQRGLGPQEGLVLLLETAVGDMFAPIHALVIRKEQTQLLPLPELSAVAELVGASVAALALRSGVRKLLVLGEEEAAPIVAHEETIGEAPGETLHTRLAEALWQPLAQAIAGLNRLHLVTHGALHSLPLTLGTPPEVACFSYPGLVFYHLLRQSVQGAPPPAKVGIRVHACKETPAAPAAGTPEHATPIPLVEAEAALVQGIWKEVINPLEFAQHGGPIACLHLAGHGWASADAGARAFLLIGPHERLTFQDVLGSALRPQVVFLSACLVGRTHEDPDGDPLGLVSAFLLRGARLVVAPLVPVSDFHMPLLALLFHQAWQEEGRPPVAALGAARQRLATGEWYPSTEARLRAAYAPVIERELAAAGAKTPAPNYALLGEYLRLWLPDFDPGHSAAEELLAQVRRTGAQAVLDQLCAKRTALGQHPPVADILRFTIGFGGPAD